MTCVLAFLIALTTAQDDVAVVVRDVPGVQPRIRCEGTAGLPDGSRLELRVYYGAYVPGRELQHRAVQVRNGAFSSEFSIFPEKNLAGSYALRVGFKPPEPSRPWSRDIPFRIGTPLEAEQDRARVLERVARDVRAIGALADDLEGRPPERAWRIAERAAKSPELKALRLEDVSGAGLLDLCNRLKAVADSAAAARAAPRDRSTQEAAREARSAFDRALRKLLGRLAAEQIGGDALAAMVQEIRERLSRIPDLAGESLDAARKEFVASLLRLQAKVPARHHAALVGLASEALALFDGSNSREERERKFRQRVEPQVSGLRDEFKLRRWEGGLEASNP